MLVGKVCSFPYRHPKTCCLKAFRPSKYIIPKKSLGGIWMSRSFFKLYPFHLGAMIIFWVAYHLTFVFSPLGPRFPPKPPRLRLLRLFAGQNMSAYTGDERIINPESPTPPIKVSPLRIFGKKSGYIYNQVWLVAFFPKIYTSQDMCRISEPSTVAQGGEVDMIYTKNAFSHMQYAYI